MKTSFKNKFEGLTHDIPSLSINRIGLIELVCDVSTYKMPQNLSGIDVDREQLESILNELPVDYLRCIEIYYGARANYRQIGDILGMSSERVRSRLNKALQLLRHPTRMRLISKCRNAFWKANTEHKYFPKVARWQDLPSS